MLRDELHEEKCRHEQTKTELGTEIAGLKVCVYVCVHVCIYVCRRISNMRMLCFVMSCMRRNAGMSRRRLSWEQRLQDSRYVCMYACMYLEKCRHEQTKAELGAEIAGLKVWMCIWICIWMYVCMRRSADMS